MRIVTFNILGGRTQHDHEVDVGVLQDAIRDLDADVLALQEVDHLLQRSGHADLTALAAEAMGAPHHRFVAALAGSPGATWTAATGDEQPHDAAYGIALLSRLPVTGWQVVRLPAVTTPVPMWFGGQPRPTWVRDEPRVAVAATVEGAGGVLTVATTHLSFVRWWNGHQLRRLVRSLSGAPRPLLLTGDLNMGTRRAARLTGLHPLGGEPTFPADRPVEQLDHVLAEPALPAVARARRMRLSDHRALVVDVELAASPLSR
ncbi:MULTISPECIES: endonuclease/exonuclease/phosphatase family protein [unclassified Nocardioides]|uniref:endonuclease/exonuclease/phosphatase family protein n=1 Tax=unclassified Nocardioides TaxID=2615069 RepID=UPI00114E251B|nr:MULTISPECIES: endonuclease/exonuclease/phosphatase family protein [unclassified Nocardioides]TQK70641.1 endonuclease/exonuclease/phosphatase family metal-dependent hydrolase [Nocardioides sp. SLBN-35]WGX99972.1 endonuclease/exonuclease/phosphatase family protein [Nocardioides sp. QY071]